MYQLLLKDLFQELNLSLPDNRQLKAFVKYTPDYMNEDIQLLLVIGEIYMGELLITSSLIKEYKSKLTIGDIKELTYKKLFINLLSKIPELKINFNS
jgi:hypothetical protein